MFTLKQDGVLAKKHPYSASVSRRLLSKLEVIFEEVKIISKNFTGDQFPKLNSAPAIVIGVMIGRNYFAY